MNEETFPLTGREDPTVEVEEGVEERERVGEGECEEAGVREEIREGVGVGGEGEGEGDGDGDGDGVGEGCVCDLRFEDWGDVCGRTPLDDWFD